ncbi:MAG: sigma-70 family RNA polymerase sigma factor [Clostridia bacterium]|nr:sigma-70 family RNA polymerase sigma factor [Clostridia bacterium]
MQSKKEIFQHYINENMDQIYRFAFIHTKNKQDAEDIVSESVLRALSAINGLKEVQYMETWFYRIILNTANSYWKKKNKIILMEEMKEEGVCDSYRNTDLYDAVMNLEMKYRVIIVLRYFEDRKIEEICEILHENQNTVKTRLYRAVDKLKKMLGEESISNGF